MIQHIVNDNAIQQACLHFHVMLHISSRTAGHTPYLWAVRHSAFNMERGYWGGKPGSIPPWLTSCSTGGKPFLDS